MDVYLRAKFEVSSIILTSFRRGEILHTHTHTHKHTHTHIHTHTHTHTHTPPQNESLKSPPRLGLNSLNSRRDLKIAVFWL